MKSLSLHLRIIPALALLLCFSSCSSTVEQSTARTLDNAGSVVSSTGKKLWNTPASSAETTTATNAATEDERKKKRSTY